MIYDEEPEEIQDVASAYNKISQEAEEAYRRLVPDAEDFEAPTWDDPIFGSEEDVAREAPQATSVDETLPEDPQTLTVPTEQAEEQTEAEEDFSYSEQTQHWRVMSSNMENGGYEAVMSAHDKNIELQKSAAQDAEYGYDSARKALEQAVASNDTSLITEAEKGVEAAMKTREEARARYLAAEADKKFDDEIIQAGSWMGESEYEEKKALNRQSSLEKENADLARRTQRAKLTSEVYANVSLSTPGSSSILTDGTVGRVKQEYGSLPSYASSRINGRLDSGTIDISRAKARIRQDIVDGKAYTRALASYAVNKQGDKAQTVANEQTRKLIRDATSGNTKRADKALNFLLAAAGTLEEEANATLAKSREGKADYNDNEFVRSLAEGAVETAVRGVDEDASLTTALQSLTEKVNDRTLGQAFGDRFQNAISLWDRDTQAERIATAIPAITSGIVIDKEGNVALSKETMQELGAVGAGTIEGGDSVILDAKRVNYIKQKYGVSDDQLLAIVRDKAARSIAPDIDKTSTTTGLAMMIPAVDENGITRKSFELNPNVIQENGRYLFNNEYIEQTKVYIKKAGGTKEDLAAFDAKLKQAQYEFVGHWHQILMDQMSGYDNYYDSIKGNYANARDAQIAAMTTYDQSYWRAGVDIFQESLTSVVGGTTSVVGIVGETGLTLFGSATTGLASEVFKAAGFRDTAVLFYDINKGVKTASYYTFGQAREAGRFLEEYASRPDAFRSGAYTAGRVVLRFAGDLAVSGGIGALAKKGAVKVATKAFAKTATSLAKKKTGEKLTFGEKFWIQRMASVAKDKKGFSEFASNAARELGVRGEEATQALTNYAKELASDPKVLAAKVAKTAPKQKAVSAAEATAKRDSSSIVGNTIADEGNAKLVSNLSPSASFDTAAGVANLEGDRILVGAMTNAAIKKLGNDAASASMQAFFGGLVASSVYSDIIWQKQNEYLENYCAEHGITREELAADKEKEEEIKREAYFDASSRAACFAIFSGVISNAINFNLFTPERTVLRKVTGENTFTGANSITARTTVAAAIDTIREASGGTLTKAAATQIVAKTAAYAAVNSVRSGFYGGLSGFIDTLQQAVFESIASGTIDQIDMETLLDSAFESATVGAVLGTVSFNLMQQGDNVFYNETSGKIQKLQGQIDASIRIEKARRVQDSIILKSALEKAKTPEERASLSERIAEKADELRELDMLNWMNLDQSTITRLFDQEISPARTEDKTGLLDIQEALLKAGAMLRLRGMQRAFNRRAEETREFLDNIGASPETSWLASLIDSMVYRSSTNEEYARALDSLGVNEDLMSYDVSRLREISTEAANFEYSQKASDGSERTLYEMREDLIAKKKATELAQANKQKQKPEDVFTEYDDAMLSEIDNAIESARALKKYVDFIVEMKEMDARNNEAEAASRATPEELSVEKAARELVISSKEEATPPRRTEEAGEEVTGERQVEEQPTQEDARRATLREKATSSAQRLLALADRANESRKKILEANRSLQSMPYEARFKNADQLKARQEEIAKETENLNNYREQLKAAKEEFVQDNFEFIKAGNEGKLNEAVGYARQKLIGERNRFAEEMPTADEARARAIVERSNEIERQLVDLEQNGWRAFNDSNFDALIGDRYEARTASKEGLLDTIEALTQFEESRNTPSSEKAADAAFIQLIDTISANSRSKVLADSSKSKVLAMSLNDEHMNAARELGVFEDLTKLSSEEIEARARVADEEANRTRKELESLPEGEEHAALKIELQNYIQTLELHSSYANRMLELKKIQEGFYAEVESLNSPFSVSERQAAERARQASDDVDTVVELASEDTGLLKVTPKQNGVVVGDAIENNPLLMEGDKRRLREIKLASQRVEEAYAEKERAVKEAQAAANALAKISIYDRMAGAEDMYNELLTSREQALARLAKANENLSQAIKTLESFTNKSAANAVDVISRSLDNSQYLSSKLAEILNAISGKVIQNRRRAVEEKAIKSIEARSQKDSAAISSAKVFAEEAKSGINQKEYLVGKRKASDDIYRKVRKLDPRYGAEFNRRRRAALAEGDPSYNIVTFAKETLAESQNFFRLAEAKTAQEFKRLKESLWVREKDNRFKVISDSNARKKIADLEALRDSVEAYDAVVKKYDDSVAKYKDAINKVALENEAFNRTLSPQVIKEVVDSGLVDQLEFSLTERQGQTELAKINPFEEGSSASIVFNEIADIIDSARLADGSDYRPVSEREIAEKLMRKVVPDEAIEKEPGKYRDTSDALRTKVVRPMLQNLKDSGFVKRMRGNQYKGTDKMFQQKMPELTSEDVMTTYEKTAQKVVVGPDSQIGEGFTVDSLFKGNEESQKFDVYFNRVELPTEAGDANGHAINKYYANEPDNFRLLDNQDKLSPEAQNMITEMGFDAESQPTRFFTPDNMAKMSTDLGSGHYNIAAAEAMMKAMGVDINNVFVRVVYSPSMQADSTQGYYMNVSKPGETPVHVITLSSQLFEQGGPGFVYDVIVHELGHAFLNKLYTSRKGFSSRLSDVADELRSNVSKNFETIKRGFLQRIAPLDDATRSKAWSMFVNTMYGLGFDVVPSKDGTTFEIVNSKEGYNPQEFFTVLISNNMMPWILNIKGPYAMKVEVGYAQMVSGDVALRNWLYSWGSSGLIDSSTTQSVANALTSYINSEAKRGEQDAEGAEAKQIVSECLDSNTIKQTASSPDEAFENFALEVGASKFAAKAMSDRLKLQLSKPNENGIDAIGADHPYFKNSSDYTDNDAVIIETPDGEIAATAYDAAISKNIVNFTAATSLKYRGKKTPFLAADGMYKFELNANDSGFIRPYEGEDGKIHDYKSFLQLVPFFRDKGNRRAMDNYLPKNVKIRLGDVYDYPELFDLYPDIADIRIIRTDELSELNANGAYDPTHNELYLSSELGPSAARAILLHELQHVIQIKERTPIGGNPSEEGATTFYITSVNEITKVRHYKWGNPPHNKLSQEVLDKWKEIYKEKIMKIANSRSISEGGKQFALVDKGEPLTEETRGLSIYHRLYGEAEARAVAKRRNYTQEQREKIPFEQDLGIAADELIIAYEKPEELFLYFVRMASRDYNDKNLPALLQSIDYDNVGNVADNPVIDVYYNKVHFENNRPERSSEQFSYGREVTPDDIANYDLSPSEASPENVFALVHQFLGDKLKGERVSLTFARLEAMMEDPSFLSGKFDEQSVTPEFVSTLHFLLTAAKQNGMIIPENMWRIMNSNSEKNMGDLVEAFKIFLRGEDGKVDDNVARSLLHGMLYIVKRINHRDVVGNAALSSSWAPTITFKAQDALRLVQDEGKLGGKRINSTGDLIREKKKYGLYVESLVKKLLKPVNYTLKALGLKEKDLSKEDAEAINEMKDVGVAVERNARAEISRLSTAMSRMADNFDIALRSVPEEQRKELAETIGKALGSTDAFISHADRVEIETRNKDELRAALKNIRTVLRELSKATEASKNDLEKQLVDIRKRIDEAEKNSDVTDDYIKALEGEDSVISSEVESLKGSIAEARMLAQEMVRLIKVESAKKLALDLANKAQETAKRMRAERDEARQKLRTGFDRKAAWVVETVDSMRKLIDDSVRDLAENRTSGADVIKRGLGVYLRRSYAPYTGKRTLDRAERIAEILSSVQGYPSYELSVRVREHFAKDLARKYVDDDVSVYANVKAKAMAFRAYKAMAENMDGGEELLAVINDAYEKADKAYATSDVASIISKQAVSDISRSGPLALAKSGYNDYWAEAWKESTAFDLLRQTNINRGYKDAINAAGSLKDYQIDSSILRPEDVFTEALAQVKSKSDHATLASLYSEAKRSLVDQGIKKLLVDEGLNLEMFSTIDEQGNRVEPDIKTLLTKIAERIRNNQSIPGLSEGMANTISRYIGEANSFAILAAGSTNAVNTTRSSINFGEVSETSSVNYLEYNLERIALRKGLIDGVNRDEARRVYKKLIDNQDQNFIDSYIKTVFDSNKSGGYDENDALLSRRNDLPEPVRQMLGEIKMNNLAGLVDTVNLTLANINRTARKNKVFYDLLNSARAIDGAIIEGARPDATGKNAYVLLTSPDGWVPEDVYKPSGNIWIKYDVLQEMKNTYYRIFSDANETSSPYERMEKYPGIIQKMFQIYTVMPLISGVAPTIRNYAGMIPMTIAPAGLINRTRLASVISNQSMLLNRIARLATKQGRVELGNLFQEFSDLGIIDSNFMSLIQRTDWDTGAYPEIQTVLETMQAKDGFEGIVNKAGVKTYEMFDKIWTLGQKLYSLPDNVGKIVAYESNLADLSTFDMFKSDVDDAIKAALQDGVVISRNNGNMHLLKNYMSEDKWALLHDTARERSWYEQPTSFISPNWIKANIPIRKKDPAIVKKIKKALNAFIPLQGPYLFFHYSMMRSVMKNVQFGAVDFMQGLKTKDFARAKSGISRALSAAGIITGPLTKWSFNGAMSYVVTKAVLAFLNIGVDDDERWQYLPDENESLYLDLQKAGLIPPWYDSETCFLFFRRNKEGKFEAKTWSSSFVNPYAAVEDIGRNAKLLAKAYSEGDNDGASDYAAKMFRAAVGSTFEASMFMSAFIGALQNSETNKRIAPEGYETSLMSDIKAILGAVATGRPNEFLEEGEKYSYWANFSAQMFKGVSPDLVKKTGRLGSAFAKDEGGIGAAMAYFFGSGSFQDIDIMRSASYALFTASSNYSQVLRGQDRTTPEGKEIVKRRTEELNAKVFDITQSIVSTAKANGISKQDARTDFMKHMLDAKVRKSVRREALMYFDKIW